MVLANLKRLLVLASISLPVSSQEINRTFIYSADLTGDGRKERVFLTIRGTDIAKPFKWHISVTNAGGRRLFWLEKEDTWIDEAYGDPDYMSGCSGYEPCKRRYYFEEKPETLAECLKGGGTRSSAALFGFENYSLAASVFLEGRKASPSTIEGALSELRDVLQSAHTTSLCFQEHQEDHGNYLVWLKTVRAFVPYYVP